MIIVMKEGATKQQVEHVKEKIAALGLRTFVSKGIERTIIGMIGDDRVVSSDAIQALPGVENVVPVLKPYKLASREAHPKDTVIRVDGVTIGGGEFTVIAGPCTVESEGQLMEAARAVKESGAKVLRGSAYKPRTSPYDFQGMGEEGLKLLRKAADELKMPVETEVMDTRNVALVSEYVDMLRIGARNMQNFDLLKEVGKQEKPVILKRGLSNSIKEFLMAAEYIMSEGNHQVILCERGIRTFETETRFTLDISAIPVVKGLSHLPIIVDPSHAPGKREWVPAPGKREWVPALSKASLAAGADGIIVEVHPHPEKALCDGPQQLTPKQFSDLMIDLRSIAKAVGKRL
ncbi:MAG: 3-deoxy-7-phosphoheptulonate synthase [Candidatus Micrarchaeota archaeon]|nr:3-deoxy-7-phosphoheptulonate synthase [Candidatus Micrarchaeota archaeon]